MMPQSGQPASKRINLRDGPLIVLLAMAVGVILALLKPLWLAPPLLTYTPLVYLALVLAWLPVLAVLIALKRIQGARLIMLLVVLGALLNFIWCALSGPQTGLELLSFGDTLQCQSERLPESRVRYTCTTSFFLSYSTYVLEGREGWPFVRLVERRLEDS